MRLNMLDVGFDAVKVSAISTPLNAPFLCFGVVRLLRRAGIVLQVCSKCARVVAICGDLGLFMLVPGGTRGRRGIRQLIVGFRLCVLTSSAGRIELCYFIHHGHASRQEWAHSGGEKVRA